MYKSPITLLVQNMESQLYQKKEQTVWEAVNALGVVVDEEELSKALKYDRDQYSKGYKDGVNEVLNKITAEIEKLNSVDYGSICSYECHTGAKYMQTDILNIIDKYKAEYKTESEGNDD